MRSRWLILLAIAAYIPLLLGGMCAEPRPDPKPPVEATTVPPPSTANKLDEAIAKAKADGAAAQQKGDRLEQLEAEKREADARAEKAMHESGEWTAYGKQLTTEITTERDHQRQVKLYWFSGIMMLAALACVAAAIWIPLIRTWAIRGVIACVAVAGVAVVFAQLIPYLIWVGGGVVVILAIAGLVLWRKDHKALHQVVEAVGAAKDKIPAFRDGYKGIFTSIIDTDAEAQIGKVRTYVGRRLAAAQHTVGKIKDI